MRRLVATSACLGALALLTGSAPGGDGPNRLTATADEASATEMTLVLSRPRIDPGRAIIEFVNSGEDDHDLQIRKKGAEQVKAQTGIVHGQEREEIELRLRREKRYELWCGLADHRELGMEAELKVRRR